MTAIPDDAGTLALAWHQLAQTSEWRHCRKLLEQQRDRRVARLVQGGLEMSEYEGVAGEVRGISLVLDVPEREARRLDP